MLKLGLKREGDAERTDANIAKAFEMTGWEPQYPIRGYCKGRNCFSKIKIV